MISAIAILGLLKQAQAQAAPTIPCMLLLTISEMLCSTLAFAPLLSAGQYLTCRRHDKRSPRPGVICRARGVRTCSRPPPSALSSVSTPAVAHCSQLQGHRIKGYGGSGRPHTTRRTAARSRTRQLSTCEVCTLSGYLSFAVLLRTLQALYLSFDKRLHVYRRSTVSMSFNSHVIGRLSTCVR